MESRVVLTFRTIHSIIETEPMGRRCASSGTSTAKRSTRVYYFYCFDILYITYVTEPVHAAKFPYNKTGSQNSRINYTNRKLKFAAEKLWPLWICSDISFFDFILFFKEGKLSVFRMNSLYIQHLKYILFCCTLVSKCIKVDLTEKVQNAWRPFVLNISSCRRE